VRILVVQSSPIVGDVAANADRMIAGVRSAEERRAAVALGTELMLSGYPPHDLLQRRDLLRACREAAERVASATGDVVAVYGCPWEDGGLRNAAVVAWRGAIRHVVYKTLLPTYDVFDEARWFVPETRPRPVEVGGLRLGVTICEDLWNEPGLVARTYGLDPVAHLRGCDLLVNLSASPFHAGKSALRRDLVCRQALQAGAPVVYANQVGGNDELLFDGNSLAAAADGRLIAQGARFAEEDLLVETTAAEVGWRASGFEEEVEQALVMGVRDYAARCGFERAVLGLSGGIDSALVAAIAAAALGPTRVAVVGMPGPYSSPGSVTDAEALARNLGLAWSILPIGAVHQALLATLAPAFAGTTPDVTEENLQARVRGTLLMALSNKFAHLLLSTGNKSEMAVGYCTLYGDMNGGLAVIGDLFKTDVYRLARWINRDGEVIPLATITKPPSAELRPNQTDQDSLPPYDQLDGILRLFVEEELDPAAIAARGYPEGLVRRVIGMVVRSEYKRWQAPPVLRVSPRAFGTGRRIPLAQRWS
jgi:NAD+ synthetase